MQSDPFFHHCGISSDCRSGREDIARMDSQGSSSGNVPGSCEMDPRMGHEAMWMWPSCTVSSLLVLLVSSPRSWLRGRALDRNGSQKLLGPSLARRRALLGVGYEAVCCMFRLTRSLAHMPL